MSSVPSSSLVPVPAPPSQGTSNWSKWIRFIKEKMEEDEEKNINMERMDQVRKCKEKRF